MSLILKENEYLRKCNESVIRNNITIPDNTSCHINDKIYIDEKKKRRRATSVSLEYNSEGEIKTSYELDQHSYIANNNIYAITESDLKEIYCVSILQEKEGIIVLDSSENKENLDDKNILNLEINFRT